MDPNPKEEEAPTSGNKTPTLSCTKCFDALWFCYSPFHQMQQYYRRSWKLERKPSHISGCIGRLRKPQRTGGGCTTIM
ncbi:uncharacterized protein LOC109723106 isoform X2 [Ananas comosus]|uniref:Uncharacterized protein LOC109723106 isoform X2 n=1 Tax=Ananas comosus TaxID=4615 RepID=A0A6P5GNF8_ANACO|nr:uncharacterized protein LOC109723106 isoform X2 [Ananas comosus]